MGMRFDSGEVRKVADQFAGAAELVDDAVRNHLSRLIFDGSCAGRAHVARGAAVRAGLDRLAVELAQWSRAAAEIAAALRCGEERYTDADLYASAGIA